MSHHTPDQVIAGSITLPWTSSHVLEGRSSCHSIIDAWRRCAHGSCRRLKRKQRRTRWKRRTWRLHLVWRARLWLCSLSWQWGYFVKPRPTNVLKGVCRQEKWLGRPCQHLLPSEPLCKGANSISVFSVAALRILLVCAQRNRSPGRRSLCVAFLWQALLLCATFQANY